MTANTAIVVASFVIFTAFFLLLVFLSKRQMQAKEEELRQAAAARGWKFESTKERGYQVHRFSGSTDGVPWTAESLRFLTGGRNKHRRRHIARWHGQWSPGVSAPIVCLGVPKGAEVPSFKVAQGDGFFAKMAQKAAGFAFDKAVDMYFGDEIGKEVDAAALRPVETDLPGFIVMAGDVDEGNRVLADGLRNALLTASNDQASVLADNDRPYVLLRARGISLARMEEFRTVDDVDQFIRAGVGLKRAFRFGRPV